MKNIDLSLSYSLLEKCCKLCTHSLATPCSLFIECLKKGPLCHEDAVCQSKKEQRRDFLLEKTPQITYVTIGMGSCGLAAGAKKVYNFFARQIKKKDLNVVLKETGCLGLCSEEVLVRIKKPNQKPIYFGNVNVERAAEIVDLYIEHGYTPEGYVLGDLTAKNPNVEGTIKLDRLEPFRKNYAQRVVMKNVGIVEPTSLEEYILKGGFEAFNHVLKSEDNFIEEIKDSGLRGRGGAGFSTGEKLELFAQENGPKVVVTNCHESDPSAFSNRALLEGNPYLVLEGLIVAGLIGGATKGIIYLKPSYTLAYTNIKRALNILEEIGLLGTDILGSGFEFQVEIKLSSGTFVAGEETALIAALSGKRPMPESRPPYPCHRGLDDRPTLIYNCETLANLPSIIVNGAKWFRNIGSKNSSGTKVFSLSGKLRRIGYIEVEFGALLREIIFDYGGGIKDNKTFKAVQIGGPTGGFLPSSLLDIPIDYETLKELGISLGSGSIVVLDNESCIVDITRFNLEYMSKESCGRCIPCREGIYRLLELMETIIMRENQNDEDLSLKRYQVLSQLEKLAKVISDTSTCGLGENVANPVLSSLRYFKEEYEAHTFRKQCLARQCKGLLDYKIDAELCRGCTVCVDRCPEGAIVGERKHSHFILQDKCTRCGICLEICPFEAIVVS